MDFSLSIYLYIYLWIYKPSDLGQFFSFLIYTQSVGILGRGSARRKAATYTQNKGRQTSMPRVEFEPTIPVFERAKTLHALDRVVTVIGTWISLP
jgi:hypothetical protein